jgi:hypothetical protein
MPDILLIYQNAVARNGLCPVDKYIFMHGAGAVSVGRQED